jgi:hypothetical protein
MGAVEPTREGEAGEGISSEGMRAKDPAPGRRSGAVVRLAAVLAAMAAGLAAWVVTERGTFRVQPVAEKVHIMGVESMAPTVRTRTAAAQREVMGVLMAFGTLLGLGMGLAGAIPARSWRRAFVACVIGALAGLLAGILPTGIVLPLYHRAQERGGGDLSNSLLMHLGLWVPLGAAAGLGYGIGRIEPRRWWITVVGGAVGAAIGTLVYDVLGAFLFPLAETGKPISEAWITRLMAFLLVALTTAAATLAVAETPAGTGPQGAGPAPAPPS